jgi:tetratricopeptide (TPR) repeat protein
VAGHLPVLANYYGSACLRTGQPQRLAAFVERLGVRPKADDEAARLVQQARASLALNRPQDGIAPARRASELAPTIAWVQEFAGQVLLAADRPDEAISMFRRALGAVADFKGWETYRASVYTQIGYAQERRFRPDLAFDEYKRALQWDPKATPASEALERIRKSTGLKR